MASTTSPPRSLLIRQYARANRLRMAETRRLVAGLAWLINLSDFRRTRGLWLDAVIAQTAKQHSIAADAAARHYMQLRRREGHIDSLTGVRMGRFAEQEARRALVVTGPVMLFRRLRRGTDPAIALRQMALSTATVASGIAADGGHATILAHSVADPQAIGWARQLSAHACSWCAMIAARGAVFSEDTAGFDAHGKSGNCRCTPVPVFTEQQADAVTARTAPIRQLWGRAEAERGDGESPQAAFRRLWRDSAVK